jgi:hypothetical protein
MMTRQRILTARLLPVVTLVCAGILLMGCQDPSPRSNAPPQGVSANPHELGENYVHMVDNALLADMSMSEVHFVPHAHELNALGVRRLNRLAQILKIYGGTVNYDGTEPDRDLRQERVERIEEYLLASGVGADTFEVQQDVAGSDGMDAIEAVAVRRATRVQEEEVGAGGK